VIIDPPADGLVDTPNRTVAPIDGALPTFAITADTVIDPPTVVACPATDVTVRSGAPATTLNDAEGADAPSGVCT
jgi:hypothetical protein